MDFLVKHWGAFPRRFPTPFPLHTADYLERKENWVRLRFNSCNFSLILKGGGEFHRKGKCWPVVAPCVITQWPGELVNYGPSGAHDYWTELYLIYEPHCLPLFRKRGFVVESKPVWPIHNVESVLGQVAELRALTQHRQPELMADRVDSVCERLVLETLLPSIESGDEVIQHIVRHLRQHLEVAHDFDRLARRYGMSLSTLRRRWIETLKVAPGRYLLELRIQRASRLLAETRMSIGEIARETGFEDSLYFSRRFKLETRLTPSEYRDRYRLRS